MKAYPEEHAQGLITFEQDVKAGGLKGDISIRIADDGRVWINVDGIALLRFRPLLKGEDSDIKNNKQK